MTATERILLERIGELERDIQSRGLQVEVLQDQKKKLREEVNKLDKELAGKKPIMVPNPSYPSYPSCEMEWVNKDKFNFLRRYHLYVSEYFPGDHKITLDNMEAYDKGGSVKCPTNPPEIPFHLQPQTVDSTSTPPAPPLPARDVQYQVDLDKLLDSAMAMFANFAVGKYTHEQVRGWFEGLKKNKIVSKVKGRE